MNRGELKKDMPKLHGANVLITGGAGFIGSHIADLALEAGVANVVIVDDLVRGQRENVTPAMKSSRVQLVVGDICDAGLVNQIMQGIDFVFHQAALRITHCADAPNRAVEVMINGLQNLLDAAVRHKVKKILAASSASVYGDPSRLPMDESHPFNNRTLYGGLKIANEQMLRAYAEMYGLQYVALRPFNVYGPRMDVFGLYTEVLIRWLERLQNGESPIIFGTGDQTMDFVYVEDVARAYLLAAESDASDEVFNVGSGIETSLRVLCQLLCREAGHPEIQPIFEPPRKINPVTRRQASIDKSKVGIGFEAAVALPEGLRELVSWYNTVSHQ